MNKINHFKILLLCKMMWRMRLTWHDLIGVDVDTLHVKRIGLNDL
jgi:hypothetical protein